MTKAMLSFFQHSITLTLQCSWAEILKKFLQLILSFYWPSSVYLFFLTMISIFASAVQKKSRGPQDHGFKNAHYFFFNLVHHHLLAWLG